LRIKASCKKTFKKVVQFINDIINQKKNLEKNKHQRFENLSNPAFIHLFIIRLNKNDQSDNCQVNQVLI